MKSRKVEEITCISQFSAMFSIINRKLQRLCSRLRWPIRRSKPKIIIRRFGKARAKAQSVEESEMNGSAIHPNGHLGGSKSRKPIRVATFNAAMFSMAPAVPDAEKPIGFDHEEEEDYLKVGTGSAMEVDIRGKSTNDRPKSILKQSPLHPSSMNSSDHLSKQHKFEKSKLRVSINLPDNAISLRRSRQLSIAGDEKEGSSSKITSRIQKGKAPLMSTVSFHAKRTDVKDDENLRSSRTILEVLREVDADILALQDVKAEEEKGMNPLSDLANALGMKYVFAESWAPEYGNAVLSKWPIKSWKFHKIFDDTDFRNVLKATIDVPHTGDLNFHCTHLDHLDENWRIKQINAIIQSNDGPHIFAGGLNSLDETDYSAERWMDIVKYYEVIGKPKPKVEVMRFLKGREYEDGKDFAGECESVVMIAKGQNVQGTCKYGTRVDYILASPDSPYQFVPASYSVISSKGTSDHHIVKVDIMKVENIDQENAAGRRRRRRQSQQEVLRITNPSSSRGVWRINT